LKAESLFPVIKDITCEKFGALAFVKTSASSDLREKKKKKSCFERKRQKKIFRVYKIPTKDAPQYCARWPHCVSQTHFFSPRDQERAREQKTQSTRNT
tara:strand:+ start:540 stop:833 length:294 start_codon:yes stop_codon:yes gene_type:complete